MLNLTTATLSLSHRSYLTVLLPGLFYTDSDTGMKSLGLSGAFFWTQRRIIYVTFFAVYFGRIAIRLGGLFKTVT